MEKVSLRSSQDLNNPLRSVTIPFLWNAPLRDGALQHPAYRFDNLVLIVANEVVCPFRASDGTFGVEPEGVQGMPSTVVSSCKPPLSVSTMRAFMLR